MNELRKCIECGVEKAIEEFPKRYDDSRYRKRTCKACYYFRKNKKRRTPEFRNKHNAYNRERMREIRASNPELAKQLASQSKRKLRRQALEKLGGKCVYCGCEVLEALEINHVNGNGGKEFRRLGTSPMHRQIKDGEYPHPVELTCRVCNAVHYLKSKGIEGFIISFKRLPV